MLNFWGWLTHPFRRDGVALPPDLDDDELEEAASVVCCPIRPAPPPYKVVDHIDFAPRLDNFIDRFQRLMRRPMGFLVQMRLVLKVVVKRDGQWSAPFYIDIGEPLAVARDLGTDVSSVDFRARPFEAPETMQVTGMTVFDGEHEAPSRGLARWRGGPQHLNPGDNLYASYSVNARDDSEALPFKVEAASSVATAAQAA
jgi:hypothetical protein